MIKGVCFNDPGTLSSGVGTSKSGDYFQREIPREYKIVGVAERSRLLWYFKGIALLAVDRRRLRSLAEINQRYERSGKTLIIFNA